MIQVYCLDLEGILLPEIWIQVALRFRLDSLKLTTRDVPDYDRLMRVRLRILRQEKIRLRDIQKIISRIRPLPGAKAFLEALRPHGPVIILSDTYYEFWRPVMNKLGNPTLFCNWLEVDNKGYISGYKLRQKDGKRKAIEALKGMGFRVRAVGDSYNDLGMLKSADQGTLFNPPPAIEKAYPRFPVARDYHSLLQILRRRTD